MTLAEDAGDGAAWVGIAGLENVYPFDTQSERGTILRTRAAVARGAVVLCERALVVSSFCASAPAANRALWSELRPLERLSNGTTLAVHAAACCAIRSLHAVGVRQRLLVQCSATESSKNSRAEAAIYRHLVAKKVLPFEGLKDAEYARLLDVIKQNAFHFEPEEGDEMEDSDEAEGLGKAIFEHARAANHSCEPNAAYAFAWDGAAAALTMSLVALSPIGASGEVLISYLHAAELASLTYAERRRRLRKTWGFDCRCARCLGDGLEHGVESPEVIPDPPATGLEW